MQNLSIYLLFILAVVPACHHSSDSLMSSKHTMPQAEDTQEEQDTSVLLSKEEAMFHKMSLEDLMEYHLRKQIIQSPELKILLTQKHQFRKMGEACDLGNRRQHQKAVESSPIFDFLGPYQVTHNDFLIVGKCSFNTTYLTSNRVVFHYNTQAGINPIPLELAQPTPMDLNDRRAMFQEYPDFNSKTQELVLTLPCTHRLLERTGASPRQYIYRFEQGNLILKQALWDSRPNCQTPPQWSQIYP
jgi:hypothetical protein